MTNENYTRKNSVQSLEQTLEQLNKDGEIAERLIRPRHKNYERKIKNYENIKFLKEDVHCAWCGSANIDPHKEYEFCDPGINLYIWCCERCEKLTSVSYHMTAIEKYED